MAMRCRIFVANALLLAASLNVLSSAVLGAELPQHRSMSGSAVLIEETVGDKFSFVEVHPIQDIEVSSPTSGQDNNEGDARVLRTSFARSPSRVERQNDRRKLIGDATGYCSTGLDVSSYVPVDVNKFAPQVRFHPLEKYFPSSVEFGYEQADLCDGQGGCSKGPFSAESFRRSTPESYLHNTDPNRYYGAGLGPSNNVLAPMYTHVIDAGNDVPYVDVQYWFYYPFNGCVKLKFGFREILKHKNYIGTWCDLGVHEGDWEHIAVRVCKDNRRVHSLRYAAHNFDNYKDCTISGQCSFVDDTHPIAYSGLDSHGTFFEAGIKDRDELPKGLFAAAPFLLSCGIFNTLRLTDVTSDDGATWEAWKQPGALLSYNESAPTFPFAGRWGKKVEKKVVQKLTYFDNPNKKLPCGISQIFTAGAKAAADLSKALDQYLLNTGPDSPNNQQRWNIGV